MTKVSYVIKKNDIQFETYTSYAKAAERFETIKNLADKPWQFTMEVVYTPFDADRTESYLKKVKAHCEKVWAKRLAQPTV